MSIYKIINKQKTGKKDGQIYRWHINKLLSACVIYLVHCIFCCKQSNAS